MNITIEESNTDKVSPLLEGIIKKIISQSKTVDTIQKDFMFILIIILMIENELVPINDDLEIIDAMNIDSDQLTKWKSRAAGIYEARIIMSGFKNVTINLIMSPLGATALINVVIITLNSETYSVCLPVSRYVVSPQATTIPMIFRDLKHFSTILKNRIVSVVKSRILTHCGYPSASLMGLPEEVLFKIILHLPIDGVLCVSKTCTRLKYLLDNEILWHNLYKRDYNNDPQTKKNDWKSLYAEAYVLQQDKKLQSDPTRTSGTMHDYMDYSDFVSYIDNPMWDVVI